MARCVPSKIDEENTVLPPPRLPRKIKGMMHRMMEAVIGVVQSCNNNNREYRENNAIVSSNAELAQ